VQNALTSVRLPLAIGWNPEILIVVSKVCIDTLVLPDM
jgi:hypothetical protein